MKTIILLKGILFLVLVIFEHSCAVLHYQTSYNEKTPSPKLLSSQDAYECLAQNNIFLKEVILVFDLQNRPTVRWSGTDSISGMVYSIDAFAKNIIKKPIETSSQIVGKLYLGGKPYKIEEKRNNFVLVPL